MELKENTKAPNFILPDQNGESHSLADCKGSWVLLYFYPKDMTPGCTIESCSLRDNFSKFKKRGVTIIGISCDSVVSHKKFAEKYKLPFILLADTEKEAVNRYGVWQPKKFMGREYMGIVRTSFLIDPKGIIRHIYEKVHPVNHTEQVLQDLRALL